MNLSRSIMKLALPSVWLFLSVCGAGGEPAKRSSFQAPALLAKPGADARKVWLVSADNEFLRFHETEWSSTVVEAKRSEFETIHILEPVEYTEALALYRGRKYEEAKAAFAAVRERFKPLEALPNNPCSLAGFHQLECMRRLGDLEGLAKGLQGFAKGALTRETQLRQLELDMLWDAARAKNWEQLETLARERANTRLPADQRAQIAYCHGLALEGLNRPGDALSAYATAMIADGGASEEITRQAALRVLAIHKADPEVAAAAKDWDPKGGGSGGKGRAKLLEAAAVARLFEFTLGAGTPLPAEYKEFLKFSPGAVAP